MLTRIQDKGFQILALHHAEAILKHDMPAALDEIEHVLLGASIDASELIKSGGGEGERVERGGQLPLCL